MKTILPLLLIVLGLGSAPLMAADALQDKVVEYTGDTLAPGGLFHVVTYDAPAAMAVKDTGLREAGLAAGPVVPKSDEIRIFANRDVMNAAPLARIWLNSREGGTYWFITGGEGDASDFVIPAGAAVVVWTRASTAPVSWTNAFR
mgnify:CR=1 FL=1